MTSKKNYTILLAFIISFALLPLFTYQAHAGIKTDKIVDVDGTTAITFDGSGNTDINQTLTEDGEDVYNASEVPGGELGGTWASPIIDTVHSGSAHGGGTGNPVYLIGNDGAIVLSNLSTAMTQTFYSPDFSFVAVGNHVTVTVRAVTYTGYLKDGQITNTFWLTDQGGTYIHVNNIQDADDSGTKGVSTFDGTDFNDDGSGTITIEDSGISHDSVASGTIAAHDTTATGDNLTELTDGSVTVLHAHSGGVGGGSNPILVREDGGSSIDSEAQYVTLTFNTDDFDGSETLGELTVTINDGGIDHNSTSGGTATAAHHIATVVTQTINDTKGNGDIDWMWSADKIYDTITAAITDTTRQEIFDNTVHSDGDGSDHADVATNTANAITNTTKQDIFDNVDHVAGDGSDHTDVASNTTNAITPTSKQEIFDSTVHSALANEHLDWEASVGTINVGNYVENVSTALSEGTRNATTYGISSDGGSDDIVLPEADTDEAGLLGADKWDEIASNTTNAITPTSKQDIFDNTESRHDQSHIILSHDTDATGANLTELTDGSVTTLHGHSGGGGGGSNPIMVQESGGDSVDSEVSFVTLTFDSGNFDASESSNELTVTIPTDSHDHTLSTAPGTIEYVTNTINDTKGDGDTAWAWSADKVYDTVVDAITDTTRQEIFDNTVHSGGDGSDHADVATNTANAITPTTKQEIYANTAAQHAESHTVVSHSDTTAEGSELNTLTDGSETALHGHAGTGETVNPVYWIAEDGSITISNLSTAMTETYNATDFSVEESSNHITITLRSNVNSAYLTDTFWSVEYVSNTFVIKSFLTNTYRTAEYNTATFLTKVTNGYWLTDQGGTYIHVNNIQDADDSGTKGVSTFDGTDFNDDGSGTITIEDSGISHDSVASGTIAAHDTTATGDNLTELTDGSDTTLHDHDGISENTTHRSSDGTDHSDVISNTANIQYVTNTQINPLMYGTFREAFDARVTSDGSIVTMSVSQTGYLGDLTMQFSDGLSTLSATYSATITLTAGTDSSPQSNYIYIPQSTKVLTKSTTAFPTDVEHIRIGYFFIPSVAYIQIDGAYINQNWNDYLNDVNNQGHLSHIGDKLRRGMKRYWSGVGGEGDGGTYVLRTDAAPDTVYLAVASGVVYQEHRHIFTAKDTSSGDNFHVLNENGDAYADGTDLYDFLNDADGDSMANKYYNLVLWGVQNKTGEYSPLMINLPACSYLTQANAEDDVNSCDVQTIPREFNLESSVGFLIARLTMKHSNPNDLVLINTVDLRGTEPSSISGGGGSTHDPVTLAGALDYLSIAGQVITMNTVDVSDDTNLGVGTGIILTDDTLTADIGSTVQAWDADLDNLADGTTVAPTPTTLQEIFDNTAKSITETTKQEIYANTAAQHAESHTVVSHSDTTAEGSELNTLTDGSETALHGHAGTGETVNPVYWIAEDGAIFISNLSTSMTKTYNATDFSVEQVANHITITLRSNVNSDYLTQTFWSVQYVTDTFVIKSFLTSTYRTAEYNTKTFLTEVSTSYNNDIMPKSVTFPDNDISPNATGQMLYDNTVTGLDGGALVWYDDDEVRYLVDLDATPAGDTYVVAYDATLDKYYLKVDNTSDLSPSNNTLAKITITDLMRVGGADEEWGGTGNVKLSYSSGGLGVNKDIKYTGDVSDGSGMSFPNNAHNITPTWDGVSARYTKGPGTVLNTMNGDAITFEHSDQLGPGRNYHFPDMHNASYALNSDNVYYVSYNPTSRVETAGGMSIGDINTLVHITHTFYTISGAQKWVSDGDAAFTGSETDVKDGSWGSYRVEVDASGNVTFAPGTLVDATPLQDCTAENVIYYVAPPSAQKATIGVILITESGSNWVAGTDALDIGTVIFVQAPLNNTDLNVFEFGPGEAYYELGIGGLYLKPTISNVTATYGLRLWTDSNYDYEEEQIRGHYDYIITAKAEFGTPTFSGDGTLGTFTAVGLYTEASDGNEYGLYVGRFETGDTDNNFTIMYGDGTAEWNFYSPTTSIDASDREHHTIQIMLNKDQEFSIYVDAQLLCNFSDLPTMATFIKGYKPTKAGFVAYPSLADGEPVWMSPTYLSVKKVRNFNSGIR